MSCKACSLHAFPLCHFSSNYYFNVWKCRQNSRERNFSKEITSTSDTLSWMANINVQYALRSRVKFGFFVHVLVFFSRTIAYHWTESCQDNRPSFLCSRYKTFLFLRVQISQNADLEHKTARIIYWKAVAQNFTVLKNFLSRRREMSSMCEWKWMGTEQHLHRIGLISILWWEKDIHSCNIHTVSWIPLID